MKHGITWEKVTKHNTRVWRHIELCHFTCAPCGRNVFILVELYQFVCDCRVMSDGVENNVGWSKQNDVDAMLLTAADNMSIAKTYSIQHLLKDKYEADIQGLIAPLNQFIRFDDEYIDASLHVRKRTHMGFTVFTVDAVGVDKIKYMLAPFYPDKKYECFELIEWGVRQRIHLS